MAAFPKDPIGYLSQDRVRLPAIINRMKVTRPTQSESTIKGRLRNSVKNASKN